MVDRPLARGYDNWSMILGGTAPVTIISLCAVASVPATRKADLDFVSLALWFVVVVVLVSLTLILMKYARKSAIEDPSSSTQPTFDLGQLRRLRDAGELSVPEYEKLKQDAIRQVPALDMLTQLSLIHISEPTRPY